jgi:hypothetical protein
MLKAIAAAACLCAAATAIAEPLKLSGQEISALVAGATIELETPLGTKLPIRYAPDGQVSAQARDLAPYLGAASDTGRWWVAADQLCHKWNRWFNSEPQCLRLRKEGRTIHWLTQNGNSGTALVAVPAPVRAAAMLPRPQPDTAKPAAAPKVPPAPADSLEAQLPPETPRVAGEPLMPAAKQPEAGLEVPAAEAPNTIAKGTPEAQRAAQPAFMVVNVARNDVLNVRSGPSAEFNVVGELPPGSRGVTITGTCLSGWCPVQHQSTSGWVNRTYLAREDPPRR